jgi:CheY-like chemotaxis protein
MTANERATEASKGQKTGGLTPCDKSRILLVDDERAILETLGRILSLRMPNCRIDVAVNGAEAVEQFSAAHHGVILMDLNMPVMDGQTAFIEIKKRCHEEKSEMPSVVFCTGYDPPDTLQTLIAGCPAHCVLRKPMTNKLLLETLQHRLSRPTPAIDCP